MSVVLLDWRGGNIGRGVADPRARANMRRMRRPIRVAGQPIKPGVAWQEMNDDDEANETAIRRDLFPAPDFTTWPNVDHRTGSLVPITLPSVWTTEDAWATKVSDGMAKVSPDRYLTIRVARHRRLHAPLAFASWQWVAGAKTNPGQAHEDYRRDALADGFSGVRVELRDLQRDGITVVYAADTNWPGCPRLLPGDHRVTQQGLDANGYVQGRGATAVRLDVRRRHRIPLNIDGHDGTGVLYAAA